MALILGIWFINFPNSQPNLDKSPNFVTASRRISNELDLIRIIEFPCGPEQRLNFVFAPSSVCDVLRDSQRGQVRRDPVLGLAVQLAEDSSQAGKIGGQMGPVRQDSPYLRTDSASKLREICLLNSANSSGAWESPSKQQLSQR
jgi:hypothetical protein